MSSSRARAHSEMQTLTHGTRFNTATRVRMTCRAADAYLHRTTLNSTPVLNHDILYQASIVSPPCSRSPCVFSRRPFACRDQRPAPRLFAHRSLQNRASCSPHPDAVALPTGTRLRKAVPPRHGLGTQASHGVPGAVTMSCELLSDRAAGATVCIASCHRRCVHARFIPR